MYKLSQVLFRRSMDTSTVVMMTAALAMLTVVYFKSPEAAQHGLSATGSLILEITPRMIAAFLLAGMVQAIVPQELIVRWMGHGSGFRGILVGMTLGGVTPGGPMTHFPIIASFYKMGVGVGPLVRSEEHTSELQSPYVISYAVFCLKRKEQ